MDTRSGRKKDTFTSNSFTEDSASNEVPSKNTASAETPENVRDEDNLPVTNTFTKVLKTIFSLPDDALLFSQKCRDDFDSFMLLSPDEIERICQQSHIEDVISIKFIKQFLFYCEVNSIVSMDDFIFDINNLKDRFLFQQYREKISLNTDTEKISGLDNIRDKLSDKISLSSTPQHDPKLTERIKMGIRKADSYSSITKQVSFFKSQPRSESYWREQLEKLKRYMRENRCHPHREHKLGCWILSQRNCFRTNNLSMEKITLLDNAGFLFFMRVNNDEWDYYFEQLKTFKNQYGNFNVEFKMENYAHLTAWVKLIRQQLNPSSKIKLNYFCSPEQEKKLKDIGFQHQLSTSEEKREADWRKRCEEMKEYITTNGNSAPSRYKEEEKRLGSWAHSQRLQYKKYKRNEHAYINKQRVAQLESIGFEFDGYKALNKRRHTEHSQGPSAFSTSQRSKRRCIKSIEKQKTIPPEEAYKCTEEESEVESYSNVDTDADSDADSKWFNMEYDSKTEMGLNEKHYYRVKIPSYAKAGDRMTVLLPNGRIVGIVYPKQLINSYRREVNEDK